jgi:hypothetical protein
VAGLAVAVLAGCGGEPYKLVGVSGKVTYEDGSVVQGERVSIEFTPQAEALDATTHPRPGIAEVSTSDGTFSDVTTHKYGDGLTAGKHTVQVFVEDENYNRTELEVTPSEIEVGGGSTELEFKVKKP